MARKTFLWVILRCRQLTSGTLASVIGGRGLFEDLSVFTEKYSLCFTQNNNDCFIFCQIAVMNLCILLCLSVLVLVTVVTGYTTRGPEYWTDCLRLDSVDESTVCAKGYKAIAKAKKVGVMLTCHPVRRQFFCSKRYTHAYWAGKSIHLKVKEKKRALNSRCP